MTDPITPAATWERPGEYVCLPAEAMAARTAAGDALARLDQWLRDDPERDLSAGIDNTGIFAAVSGGSDLWSYPVGRGDTLAQAVVDLAARLEDDNG